MSDSVRIVRGLVSKITEEHNYDPSFFGWKEGHPNNNVHRHPALPGHTLSFKGNEWSHNIGYGSTLAKSIGSGRGEKSLSNHLIAFHNKGWGD
jgi:hypothetical protein